MVVFHLDSATVGDFVGLVVPREQGVALLIWEDRHGLAAGGATDAHAGHLDAPTSGFGH